MPDLPALPLGTPQVVSRATRRSPRPRLQGPGRAAQQRRLGPEFARLTELFEAGRLTIADEPAALAPEQVLVLEVAGELSEFARAIRQVQGLEFLAEEAEERLAADVEFAAVDPDGRRHPYTRQLFLMSSDAAAWQQLLNLWGRFQRDEPFQRGLTPFRDLFSRLRSLRAWDDTDRLERTGALTVWQRELAQLDNELVEFEIELWLRRDPRRRDQTVSQLRGDLEAVGGELLAELILQEISYHGMLGLAPAYLLLDAVARHEVRWLKTDAVRFFRAVGQIAAVAPLGDELSEAGTAPAAEMVAASPRLALLDGIPLNGHALLQDRVVIDDPDGLGGVTPAQRRLHGTAMASVVIHGDLGASGAPQSRPLYVRPILTARAPDWVRDVREELPRDRLAVVPE